MKTSMRRKFHTAETAMLFAICITLCLAVWGRGQSKSLSSELIRLHVIAASDEAEEQALKLRVRDAVLAYAEPLLEGSEDAAEAYEIINASQDALLKAAESAAEGRAVTVSLSREMYPTRYYDGFALPAGEYSSLRIMLGEAEGQNWWCVVFPPLCTSAGIAEATPTMSEDGQKLITQDSEGYVFRFRAMELWGELSAALG